MRLPACRYHRQRRNDPEPMKMPTNTQNPPHSVQEDEPKDPSRDRTTRGYEVADRCKSRKSRCEYPTWQRGGCRRRRRERYAIQAIGSACTENVSDALNEREGGDRSAAAIIAIAGIKPPTALERVSIDFAPVPRRRVLPRVEIAKREPRANPRHWGGWRVGLFPAAGPEEAPFRTPVEPLYPQPPVLPPSIRSSLTRPFHRRRRA